MNRKSKTAVTRKYELMSQSFFNNPFLSVMKKKTTTTRAIAMALQCAHGFPYVGICEDWPPSQCGP